MAVIWQKQHGDTLYEIRSAGNSRRLYTNGVFHSQYNSRQLFTGSVWDLLSLPGLFLYPQEGLRILVLGVGGGTTLQQLNCMLRPSRIVGIEWDKMHIDLAKRFFGLRQDNIQLIHHDAQTWLRAYRGKAFDIIVDDLFTDQGGEPIRAVDADKSWFRSLTAALSPGGLIAQNHVSPKSFRGCAYFKEDSVRANFESAFRLHSGNIDNVIGVFCRRKFEKSQMVNTLADLRRLTVSVNRHKLDYVMRKITT